eukprot:scaffold60586_cov61-Phaeocystis_antarctica.AAC.3
MAWETATEGRPTTHVHDKAALRQHMCGGPSCVATLPMQASSRRSTSNTRRWTTRRRAACTTASSAPTSPAPSRTRRTSPATSRAITSAPACRRWPPLGSATARHPGSAGWRVARRTRGRALAAPISTRACGAAVSACQRSRHPPFCGCTAGLSATRRTRHDGPLGCAGSHVWQLRGGPCLPPSVPPQVSLLIYKSKDSPFD